MRFTHVGCVAPAQRRRLCGGSKGFGEGAQQGHFPGGFAGEGADFSVGFNVGVGLRGEALEVDGREDFGVGSELG